MAARLHRREPLFTPEVRTAVVALLREHVAVSDVELFAYIIMPNHLHLVVRQGDAPLWNFMQPLIRRAALLVQRRHRREGHVFERRYRDRPCGTAEHIRNAIVYTHLNPVRAELCTEPGDYDWSSYPQWTGGGPAADGGPQPASVDRVAEVFAQTADRTRSRLISDYRAFQEWRRELDRQEAAETGEPMPASPPKPPVAHGDAYWMGYLAPEIGATSTTEASRASAEHPRTDLSVIARAVLNDADPGLLPTQVRSRWGGPPYVEARHAIIRRAAIAGYGNHEIAAYLRISRSAVSAVLTAARKRLLPTDDE